jgi:hypothetical protein
MAITQHPTLKIANCHNNFYYDWWGDREPITQVCKSSFKKCSFAIMRHIPGTL